MVIIFSKTLEKKGVNDVRCTQSDRLLRKLHAMSRGTTLFSRGTVEADRWIDMGRDCTIQHAAPCQPGSGLEGLWAALPHQRQPKCSGDRMVEMGHAPAITTLIRDLSLVEGRLAAPPSHETTPVAAAPAPNPAPEPAPNPCVVAPPIKRQCRSLSLSDEFGSCRSSWRPQGSRVWTAVEKRRCHSGGNVRAGGVSLPTATSSGGHFPGIQRSFSFSLPSRSCVLADGAALELPCFTQGLAFQPLFTASPQSPNTPPPSLHGGGRDRDRDGDPSPGRLSLSQEHPSMSEACRTGDVEEEQVSDASSQDSTPELGRRGRGRPCGRSLPCELNDKKTGMKRRRPEDAQEPRPSLDLAKMTQNLQTFQSLNSFGIPTSSTFSTTTTMTSSSTTTTPQTHRWSPGYPPYGVPGRERSASAAAPRPGPLEDGRGREQEEDSSYEEELDSGDEDQDEDEDSACSVGSSRRSPTDDMEEDPEEHTLWKGFACQGARGRTVHLGGELDLDQIERN